MTHARQQLGELGEDLAVRELTRRGYVVLARRFRTRHGEIDIVADDHGTIVFVEVRARATREFGRAAETVTLHKQRRVTARAVEYLSRHHLTHRPCRFDVVAIDDADSARPAIVVYTAAFDAT
jgi:putative endonuclease